MVDASTEDEVGSRKESKETMQDLIKQIDADLVKRETTKFDTSKLSWINKELNKISKENPNARCIKLTEMLNAAWGLLTMNNLGDAKFIGIQKSSVDLVERYRAEIKDYSGSLSGASENLANELRAADFRYQNRKDKISPGYTISTGKDITDTLVKPQTTITSKDRLYQEDRKVRGGDLAKRTLKALNEKWKQEQEEAKTAKKQAQAIRGIIEYSTIKDLINVILKASEMEIAEKLHKITDKPLDFTCTYEQDKLKYRAMAIFNKNIFKTKEAKTELTATITKNKFKTTEKEKNQAVSEKGYLFSAKKQDDKYELSVEHITDNFNKIRLIDFLRVSSEILQNPALHPSQNNKPA